MAISLIHLWKPVVQYTYDQIYGVRTSYIYQSPRPGLITRVSFFARNYRGKLKERGDNGKF